MIAYKLFDILFLKTCIHIFLGIINPINFNGTGKGNNSLEGIAVFFDVFIDGQLITNCMFT